MSHTKRSNEDYGCKRKACWTLPTDSGCREKLSTKADEQGRTGKRMVGGGCAVRHTNQCSAKFANAAMSSVNTCIYMYIYIYICIFFNEITVCVAHTGCCQALANRISVIHKSIFACSHTRFHTFLALRFLFGPFGLFFFLSFVFKYFSPYVA